MKNGENRVQPPFDDEFQKRDDGCNAVDCRSGAMRKMRIHLLSRVTWTSIRSIHIGPFCDTCQIYDSAVYEGLLSLDKDNKVIPVLAESYTANGDQTEFTFKINPKAIFSDGAKVEAKDVKWSWERLKNVKGSPSFLADTIDSIENA
jgi:ABC-type transport system substrate-binding protein